MSRPRIHAPLTRPTYAELEAENARLQEREKETDRLKAEWNGILHPKGDGPVAPGWADLISFAEREALVLEANQHDSKACVPLSLYNEANTLGRGYKAQSERRREALNNMWGLHHGFEHKGHLNRETCPATSCQDARAAIDMKPEQAKEGQVRPVRPVRPPRPPRPKA